MFTSITGAQISIEHVRASAWEQRTLIGRLVSLALHSGQGLCYSLEKGLNVVADLCAGLDEHEVVLLGLLFALGGGDFALVVQVGLVAHEDNDDVGAALAAHIVDPFACLLERLCA